MKKRGKGCLGLLLLITVFYNTIIVQSSDVIEGSDVQDRISTDSVIHQGLSIAGSIHYWPISQRIQLSILENWLDANQFVAYASRIQNSITVKFIDGSYTVLLDPFPIKKKPSPPLPMLLQQEQYGTINESSAILLNPEEFVYGHRQCQQIISILLKHDYQITYKANAAVTLSYLRFNLSADIVYFDTHAGFFDTDGDHLADAVVIATGETWKNDTEQTYNFEFQNHMIVKGMIGEKSIIAFTPAFIEYYYPQGSFPDSLIFMATCFATYDSSMAQAFLQAGASAYVGWSNNTFFWINSRTSVQAINLLACGMTVQQICQIIHFGGIMNRLFHSKLMFYGDGQHQIPRTDLLKPKQGTY